MGSQNTGIITVYSGGMGREAMQHGQKKREG